MCVAELVGEWMFPGVKPRSLEVLLAKHDKAALGIAIRAASMRSKTAFAVIFVPI